MKITYVAQKLDMDGGGSNFSLELMCRMLSKEGHDVTVLTLDPEDNNYPSDISFDVISSKTRFGTRMGVLEQAYRTMSEHASETDLFHVFSPMLLPAAGYFRKKDETTPVVGRLNTYTMFCVNLDRMDGSCHRNCTVRSKFAHQDASLQKRIAKIPFYTTRTFIEPRLSGNLDRYFAISPAVKEIYASVGLPADRISVVPNFYDPTFGQGEQPVQNPVSEGPLQLLYVGRIERIKGLDCLINAVAQTSNIELTVLGTGSAVSDLRELAQTKEIGDRVSFEGWTPHDELPSHYARADLFVHPARWPEPFGRTLLESMQMGTPALVADIGGPPWVVGDAGFTFPRENVERLSEILSNISDNPDRVVERQKSCAAELERYEPHRVVSSIEKEYNRLTDR
jgi:glycosyltransferase involved in cell wall biosynthesis